MSTDQKTDNSENPISSGVTDITKEEIAHLARLARIAITDEEAAALQPGINDIIGYVGAINELTAEHDITKKVGPVHNVLRPDEQTNEAGAHTEDLLQEAPVRDGRYVKVKKILNTD